MSDSDRSEAEDSVREAVERAAAEHSLVLIGATEGGLVSRLVSDSLHYDVVTEVGRPVVLAERPSKRSLRHRLFGRRWGVAWYHATAIIYPCPTPTFGCD